MWDRKTFVRPAAHRGLHNQGQGIIENTWPAFEAAIENGFAIECDLQRTRDNIPVVFHDFTLDRLTNGAGPVSDLDHADFETVTYQNQDETILSFADMLKRVAGRTPLLVELKSDWCAPHLAWLKTLCELSLSYTGPLALMSFDPAVMHAVREIAPDIARGLVSGHYRHPDREPWYSDVIPPERAEALSNLADLDTVQPDFIAYHVKDLDCEAVQTARQKHNLPIFTWTVRSDSDWQLAKTYADAPIFEGLPRESSD